MSYDLRYPTEGEITLTITGFEFNEENYRRAVRAQQDRAEITAALHEYQARTGRPRRPKYHPVPLP